ncbi:MAG: type II secretion system protein N [Wenzhouxiangella sp.]
MNATLSPRQSARLALLLSAVTAVIILWLLVRLLWLVLAGPEVQSAPMPPLPQTQASGGQRERFSHPLFGQSDDPNAIIAPIAPARRDSLRLRGIVSGPRAYAIIADSNGRETVYRIDDELPDGSRVQRIEAQRVILVRAGRQEALELNPDRRDAAPARPSSTSRPAGSLLDGGGLNLDSLQRLPSPQGQAMASQVSILPVSSGGFRVRPSRDARWFAELGLQVNDIVTAVNGQLLETEDDARALFRDVLQGGDLAITINRQGQELVLRPDTERLLRSLQNP